MVGISPLVLGLLVLIFLMSSKGFKDPIFFNRLKFNVGAVENGEYYRLLSAGFIHVDQQHLLFNGLTLYFFGDNLIYGLGLTNTIVLYVVSLLVGNLSAFLYHRNNPYYSAVGASGAIMGVVYSSILIFPDMRLGFIFFPIPIPAYLFGIGYLVYTLFGIKRQQDGIGHTAHLGGAIGGVICTLFFDIDVLEKSGPTLLLMIGITCLAALVFFRRT